MMVVFTLFAAVFLVYVLAPFFEKAFRNVKLKPGSSERENLLIRKEEILAALEDLEYDFKMNKMSEQDYRQLKEKMTAEALEMMKQIDSMNPANEVIPEISVQRASKKHRAGKVRT